VDKISPPKAGREEHFDKHLPGFGLRVSKTGAKSWVVFYRVARKQRRYTIGTLTTYPKVEDARDRAREIQQAAERGIDLAAEKAAAASRQPDTVAEVVTLFIERYAKPKNRSWRTTEQRLLSHVVPKWGTRDILSITRRNMIELLDGMVDAGKPIAANRVLAAVRKMFNWAVEREIVPFSPIAKIQAPGKETSRERVLTDDELARVYDAAEREGGISGAFVRALILTGQRRTEVATMRWADVDLAKNVWTLPQTATKADRSHEVPLAPAMVALLAGLPRTGGYVFSARGYHRKPGQAIGGGRLPDRDRPLSGYAKIKAKVDKKVAELAKKAGEGQLPAQAELGREDTPPTDGARTETGAGWRFHDLRRTVGTGMARLGIAVSTISRVLNHKEGGVTQIYNRYSYLDEKRHALETWVRHVESLVRPAEGNVVAFHITA
jgi:integrase